MPAPTTAKQWETPRMFVFDNKSELFTGKLLQAYEQWWSEGSAGDPPCPDGYTYIGTTTIGGKLYCLCANGQHVMAVCCEQTS